MDLLTVVEALRARHSNCSDAISVDKHIRQTLCHLTNLGVIVGTANSEYAIHRRFRTIRDNFYGKVRNRPRINTPGAPKRSKFNWKKNLKPPRKPNKHRSKPRRPKPKRERYKL
ncbi:uncharacterized protein LOC108602635 isoform X2 [Drosophila busckii]|uniref:uncharacterized protein LOC108602635 isoform X2 n=1 Tax=Drosophila busckii TaxID=30019 RepID=UPI00083EC34F|nr:uncharacterized protein LOC108602635 isoform X2 [Drosophila busckii]